MLPSIVRDVMWKLAWDVHNGKLLNYACLNQLLQVAGGTVYPRGSLLGTPSVEQSPEHFLKADCMGWCIRCVIPVTEFVGLCKHEWEAQGGTCRSCP